MLWDSNSRCVQKSWCSAQRPAARGKGQAWAWGTTSKEINHLGDGKTPPAETHWDGDEHPQTDTIRAVSARPCEPLRLLAPRPGVGVSATSPLQGTRAQHTRPRQGWTTHHRSPSAPNPTPRPAAPRR